MGTRKLNQNVQEGKVLCEGSFEKVKEWVAQAKGIGEIAQVCLGFIH